MDIEEILVGCLGKKASAQKKLYDYLSPRMMGVCMRYSDSVQEAEDVLQDGFVKLFDKLETFGGTGSFEGWARRLFVNTALDAIRKKKKYKYDKSIDDVAFMLNSNDYIEESLAADDLMKILQKIPVGYRTVFNLYAIEGYSHKEIAEQLSITVSTSKSQYSRAKSLLRSIIEKLDLKFNE